jgi:transcriptional regulator with XRE-family HTH domain
MPRLKFSEMLQDWPMKGKQGGQRAARLEELRKSRSITQAKVAEHLGTNQGEVSRIERRTDIYISTLAQYIQALGGKLEIRAVFRDSEVRIAGFEGK